MIECAAIENVLLVAGMTNVSYTVLLLVGSPTVPRPCGCWCNTLCV